MEEKTTQLRNMFLGVKLDELLKDWETTMLDQAGGLPNGRVLLIRSWIE